jgi:hypothetical protein
MSAFEEELAEEISGTLDELDRILRECLELAEVPQAEVRMARVLVDGLLAAEYGRVASSDGQGQPWPFPSERAGALNIEFLVSSAEKFLADIRTAVMILRSKGPAHGGSHLPGRRHGVDPEAEGACVCGWRSTDADLVPIAHHFLAVVELGGGR